MPKPLLSICIPLQCTDSYRRRNWRVVANELSELASNHGGIEIIAAEFGGNHADDYPLIKRVDCGDDFTRSRARNAALSGATADLICFCDADMLMPPEQWLDAIQKAREVDCFSPYRHYQRLGKQKTANRIINDRWDWTNPVNNSIGGNVKKIRGNLTGGIFFCSRKLIESVGKWDEDFTGWGFEDIALAKAIESSLFSIEWGKGTALHIFHPRLKRGRQKSLTTLRAKYQPLVKVASEPQTGDIFSPQPAISCMVAVTALSRLPHHISRQTECLNTWKDFGLDVIAVNTREEIAELSRRYPQVDHWRASENLTESYATNHTQKITSLTEVSAELNKPILLINSDIEIRGDQSRLFSAIRPGEMTIGVRHNYATDWRKGERERWGFDAFYIEPSFARSLPRLDLGIGKPVWDYWLPIHCYQQQIRINVIQYGLFFHQSHPQKWTLDDSDRGIKVIQSHYGHDLDVKGFRRRML